MFLKACERVSGVKKILGIFVVFFVGGGATPLAGAFFAPQAQNNCALPLYLAALQAGHGQTSPGSLAREQRRLKNEINRFQEAIQGIEDSLEEHSDALCEGLKDDYPCDSDNVTNQPVCEATRCAASEQIMEYMKEGWNQEDAKETYCSESSSQYDSPFKDISDGNAHLNIFPFLRELGQARAFVGVKGEGVVKASLWQSLKQVITAWFPAGTAEDLPPSGPAAVPAATAPPPPPPPKPIPNPSVNKCDSSPTLIWYGNRCKSRSEISRKKKNCEDKGHVLDPDSFECIPSKTAYMQKRETECNSKNGVLRNNVCCVLPAKWQANGACSSVNVETQVTAAPTARPKITQADCDQLLLARPRTDGKKLRLNSDKSACIPYNPLPVIPRPAEAEATPPAPADTPAPAGAAEAEAEAPAAAGTTDTTGTTGTTAAAPPAPTEEEKALRKKACPDCSDEQWKKYVEDFGRQPASAGGGGGESDDMNCDVFKRWGKCAQRSGEGQIKDNLCKKSEKCQLSGGSLRSLGSSPKCRSALKEIKKQIETLRRYKKDMADLQERLTGIDEELMDIRLYGTEGRDCADCDLRRLRQVKEIVDPAPSGWQTLGNVVGTLGAAALGLYGVRQANKLRDLQGFSAQPQYALQLAYPFLMKSLYGGGLFSGGSNSLACSPTAYNNGFNSFGNPFLQQQFQQYQQAHYMQQMHLMQSLYSSGGFPGMNMMGNNMGGFPGRTGLVLNIPGMNMGGFPGMNMGGFPGMNMGGNNMGGFPGMNMGGFPGMNMGGNNMGGFPGMNMGGFPGMNMMGNNMMGGMMAGGQDYMKHWQARMNYMQAQMNNYMQKYQAASHLMSEISRLQQQVYQIMNGGGGVTSNVFPGGGGGTTGSPGGGGGTSSGGGTTGRIIRGL